MDSKKDRFPNVTGENTLGNPVSRDAFWAGDKKTNTRIRNFRGNSTFYKFLFIYSVLFLLISLVCFYWHVKYSRTLIWQADSWKQHYKAMIYYAEYVRNIIRELLINHRLVIPQFEMALGEGGDVLQILNYYGIGDPFTFFCFMVPSRYMYIYYHGAILFRMYLCGISFAWMFWQIKADTRDKEKLSTQEMAVCIASLMYAFCFWNIYNSMRHPFFINPLIYLPMIIGSVERIIRSEKPTIVLNAAIFFCAISNFYFFYITVLITVVYVIIRLICVYKLNVKKQIQVVRVLLTESVLSVLLASFILMPVVYAYISDPRMSGESNFLFIYPSLQDYKNILKLMFCPGVDDYWICGGFGLVGTSCLFRSVTRKNSHTTRSLFFACFITLMIPFLGQVFNAFKYVTHKWVWAAALLVSYCTADELSKIKRLFIKKQLRELGLFFCGVTVVATIVFNSYKNNSPSESNYVEECIPIKDVNSRLYESDAAVLKKYKDEIKDCTFSRYETRFRDYNNGLLFGLSTPQYYWTLSNYCVKEFGLNVLTNTPVPNIVRGYDERIAADSLSSVKYYILEQGGKSIPYEAEYLRTDGNYDLYSNPNALDLTYSYDSYIDRELFETANACEKESLMTKGAVLSEEEASLCKIDPETDCITVKKLGKNKLTINESYKTEVSYDGIENSETVVIIKNLRYSGENKDTAIRFKNDNGAENAVYYYTEDHQYYHGIKDYAANMGYDGKKSGSIEITFVNPGTYEYDSIEIVCHSMTDFRSDMKKLQGSGLDDLDIETDCISGRINTDKNRILCVAIPFSSGWEAYVDGEKTDIIRVNIKYMGILLKSGVHDVVFRYNTPLRKPGLIVSLFTLAAMIILRRKRKGTES